MEDKSASASSTPVVSPAYGRTSGGRIASLDQFRGYTVLGMFVVNFIGAFAVTPAILKHHNTYCSYADTIMPQFLFAVGFAYRLAYLRRRATMDRRHLHRRFAWRILGLIVVGGILYVGLPGLVLLVTSHEVTFSEFSSRALRTYLFQALVHIGVTSLWILPVIGAGAKTRIVFAAASAALQVVLSYLFYYRWVTTTPGIDGGPLGFLTWTLPTLAGSLAYDIVSRGPAPKAARRLLGWGCLTMALGYGLSCVSLVTPPNGYSGGGLGAMLVEPPFVPPTRPVNLWTMNQQAGSVSYLTFGAGLSLALYAFFVWASDIRGLRSGILRTFGTNALAGYVVHIIIERAMKPFIHRDASAWTVLPALGIFLALCYLCVRLLERKGIYLRL